MRASVRFGNEIDLIFDHFKANDDVRVRADDRSALRKTGRGTRSAGFEAQVCAGVDRLLDDGAVFATDQ